MRKFIAQLIMNDTVLRNLGLPAGAVYQANTVDTPAEVEQPGQPFIVIKWSDQQSAEYASRRLPSQPSLLDIWCYHAAGDYSTIDLILKRLQVMMDGVAGQQTDTGWITQIDWVGNGGDNYDDVYKAIVRTATFRVVGSVNPPS